MGLWTWTTDIPKKPGSYKFRSGDEPEALVPVEYRHGVLWAGGFYGMPVTNWHAGEWFGPIQPDPPAPAETT